MARLRRMIGETLLTCCGCGYVPMIGPTLASLLTVPFALMLHLALPPSPLLRLAVLAALICFFALAVAVFAEPARAGARVDRREIVLDEVVGMLIAIAPFFVRASMPAYALAVCFVAFRFFDVLKPLGIAAIDRRNTAASVVLDDMLAGLYALCVALLLT